MSKKLKISDLQLGKTLLAFSFWRLAAGNTQANENYLVTFFCKRRTEKKHQFSQTIFARSQLPEAIINRIARSCQPSVASCQYHSHFPVLPAAGSISKVVQQPVQNN